MILDTLEGFHPETIIIIISVLLIIALIIILFLSYTIFRYSDYLKDKNKINYNQVSTSNEADNYITTENKKPISLEDIQDEDMMVAILVATIDYRNETKQDVRLVSVKQIG